LRLVTFLSDCLLNFLTYVICSIQGYYTRPKKTIFFIALYCKHCKEGAILVTQFLTPLKYLKKYRKKNISIKEKWDKEEKK
jgi:hypothetical protein